MTTTKQHNVSWKDGDQPVSDMFGDMFYSPDNGQAEVNHVFLAGNGLPDRWPSKPEFVIAELGFGTGLNFLETWRQWAAMRKPDQTLVFQTFEAFPLTPDLMQRAHRPWPHLAEFSEALMAKWQSGLEPVTQWEMDAQTRLHVCVGDAQACLTAWDGSADAWYLDGFAPSKNPDMWSADLMREVFRHTRSGGTIATYTSAGWVRRNLTEAGFMIEKRPGFAGKREMVVGQKS